MNELDITDDYERMVVQEFNLNDQTYGVDREFSPSGTNTPVPGMLSLGWTGWKDLPAADFVKNLIDWQVGFYRDHSSEPFFPDSKPIYSGELSWDDLVKKYSQAVVNNAHTFEWEPLAMMRAHMTGHWEVRDIIRRHYFEETGHSDMMFDFVVNALGVRREVLYERMNPANFGEAQYETWTRRRKLCEKGHFVEVAAAQMLWERIIPRPNRMIAIGLRKHYNISNKYMTFFDVHSYIDIYHERFGKYILAKYATTKELQDAASTALMEQITSSYERQKANWETTHASKR